MPDYSPTINAGSVKRNQYHVASTISLPPYGSGISLLNVLQQLQSNFKTADLNTVRQVSIIDSSGRRCAVGQFINGIFVPGEGFINPSCPVHGSNANSLSVSNSGSGGGTDGNSGCTCGFFPYLMYWTDFHVCGEDPDDPCENDCDCPSSAGPIRYWDGKIIHSVQDINSNGILPWGHSRSYDNTVPFDLEQHIGYRWRFNSLPHLVFSH
ncbi:MAG: hypothetical protein LBK82_08910, partial [Planctomycetaceae bacterium]|nr:hypothetical protein [Planctomycetaceae bacterium]